MAINCIIIHEGYKEYVRNNLQVTAKYNKVFLVGDKSMEVLGELDNIVFLNINKYNELEEIKKLRNCFKNYSTNGCEYEWCCFKRVFIIEKVLEEFNLDNLFHLDSDCILIENINNYKFTRDIAYCLCNNFKNPFRMCGSIHCGLLNKVFCQEFRKLYIDIFENGSKFKLIESKINYHKKYRKPGGICDMTLYYLLWKENLIDIQNLLDIGETIDGNKCIFTNLYMSSEGFREENQYQIKNRCLEITSSSGTPASIGCSKKDGKNFIKDLKTKEFYQLFNIHFQGGSKKFLTNDLKNIY